MFTATGPARINRAMACRPPTLLRLHLRVRALFVERGLRKKDDFVHRRDRSAVRAVVVHLYSVGDGCHSEPVVGYWPSCAEGGMRVVKVAAGYSASNRCRSFGRGAGEQ